MNESHHIATTQVEPKQSKGGNIIIVQLDLDKRAKDKAQAREKHLSFTAQNNYGGNGDMNGQDDMEGGSGGHQS